MVEEKIEESIKKDSEKNSAHGEKKESDSIGREMLRLILYLAFVVVVCLLVVKYVAVRSVVDGSSMNPLLNDGDNLIVEKMTYHFQTPKRFDVVVFELANEPDVHYIKRVIGLPGETVQVIDGYVYVTEVGETTAKKLDTDIYGLEVMTNAYAAAEPITLGDDEYFVLGDNRNNSLDSRSVQVGLVKRKQIIGRAWLRFWPIGDWEIL